MPHTPAPPDTSASTPSPDDTPYRPIACSLYDRLEALATRGADVDVAWKDADGTVHRATARIADVYAEGDADWLRLADATAGSTARGTAEGMVVRLDRLVSLGG